MTSDMDSASLFAADRHPDENQLLLALERELPRDEAAQIERHLGKCWSCRARSDEMQRGILAFVEYREKRYLPLLPESPQNNWNFPKQLRDAARENSSPGWLTRQLDRLKHVFIPRWRIQWASATAGLIAAVVFWVHVLLVPSSLTAGEVLLRATAAQKPMVRLTGNQNAAGWTVHQKIRVRVGAESTVRDLNWASGESGPQPRWDPGTNAADWYAPLSAAGFAAWHDGLRRKTDRIKRWGNRLTLITNPMDTPIREATLVMRFSDFHPFEERIQFATGLEVSIQEIEFAIVPEKVAPPRRGSIPSRISAPTSQQSTPKRQTPAPPNLDDIELDIRYRMFRQQFDLGEDFKVSQDVDRVVVKGASSSAERAREIRALLNSVPGVRVSITAPDYRGSALLPEGPNSKKKPPSAPSLPVLQDLLDNRFGSDEERRAFVDRCLTASDDALSHAWALRNLAERYTTQSENLLSSSSRAKLHEMLSSHINKLREFTSQLKPLIQMLPDGPVPEVELPPDWNATALSVFDKVQQQDTIVGAFLAGTEQPVQSKEALVGKFRFTYNSIGVLLDRLKTSIH